MAILGYNDVLQLPEGSLQVWGDISATVGAGCAGAAVSTLPVTNVLDRAINKVWRRDITGFTPGGLTGTVVLNIELISGWLDATGYNVNNVGLIGLLGLRTWVGAPDAGSEYDLQIRIKGSATAFGGTDAYDQTRTFYAQEFPGAWPRQVWFDNNLPSADDPLAGGGVGAKAGRTPVRYWQFEITPLQTPPGPYSMDIGRVVMMNAFVAAMEPVPTLNFRDESEVQRSFSGVPYALRGSASRVYAGKFLRLDDRAVYGHSAREAGASVAYGSTINSINRLAGRRGEVVIVPTLWSKTTGTGGRLPSAWQTQPVFGLLDNGIEARRVTTVESAPAPGSQAGALWEADFSITETPT